MIDSKLKLFLLCAIFFCCKQNKISVNNSFTYLSSGYYENVYLADSLFIEGEFKKSYEILKGTFKKQPPINMDIYYEYETYLSSAVELGKSEFLCDELKSLISNYGYNEYRISNNPNIDKLLDSCPEVKRNIKKLYEEFKSKIKLSLRNELLGMAKNDQKFRQKGKYQDNIIEQERIDEINTKRIIEIFEKFGYPNQKLVGDYFVDEKHLIFKGMLLHTNDSIRREYFIPKLLEFIKKGECNPLVYATIVDQLNLYNGNQQLFGTYSNNNIYNFKKIDSTRKSIGLPKYGYENWRVKKLYGHIDFQKIND